VCVINVEEKCEGNPDYQLSRHRRLGGEKRREI
jgi:hypothetical protein